MGEAKLRRVQCLAMKAKLLQHLAMRLSRAAVNRIAEQRVADRRHVHANLVRAPGFEPAFDAAPRPSGARSAVQ